MAARSPAMIVTNTPAKDLAYTNFAYCSPSDLRNFLVPGSSLSLALIEDAFVLSIEYPFYCRSRCSLANAMPVLLSLFLCVGVRVGNTFNYHLTLFLS